MWLSGTEVNIDFQSSIIDPSKKKLSNFENACSFQGKKKSVCYCEIYLKLILKFFDFYFFSEQLVIVQLAELYENFLCLPVVLGAGHTQV